jgi:hypothetical protein
MPSNSPGTLFIGQTVFLIPGHDSAPPFILLITEVYPPNHPSGKTGCGYYFWRAEDIRVLSNCTEFKGSDEDSAVYVTRQKAEFKVDEIMDLADVQPYFVGEQLGGLYYKVSYHLWQFRFLSTNLISDSLSFCLLAKSLIAS